MQKGLEIMKNTENEIIAQIPEEVRAKYEKLFEELFEKARAKAEASAKKPKVRNGYGEEEVSYTFFKDDGEYSDDVYIGVNGERIVCQRGVPVKIKRKFVWAYEQAQAQQRAAANMVAATEMRYRDSLKSKL